MPCLAITFGQAPHAAHRVLSQFATMASRTRIAGRLAGLDFNTFSARLTPFRQALAAFRSITTRNIKRTQLLAEPSPPEVRALGAVPHGKLYLGNRVTCDFALRSPRRNVTRFWVAQSGHAPSNTLRLAPSVPGHGRAAA